MLIEVNTQNIDTTALHALVTCNPMAHALFLQDHWDRAILTKQCPIHRLKNLEILMAYHIFSLQFLRLVVAFIQELLEYV